MHTHMYLSLNANGTLHQSRQGSGIPSAILADFTSHAAAAKALVVGRTTFDLIEAAGAMDQLSAMGVSPFVLTRSPLVSDPVVSVPTPEQAVGAAGDDGHTQMLVAGGAKTYEAFLSAGLVDTITLNILPTLTEDGLRVAVDASGKLELNDHSELGDGVLQLRYLLR